MLSTPTPFQCDTCGITVTDHVLDDGTVINPKRFYRLLCEACFDALPAMEEDEYEDERDWPADVPFDPYKYYGVHPSDFH